MSMTGKAFVSQAQEQANYFHYFNFFQEMCKKAGVKTKAATGVAV